MVEILAVVVKEEEEEVVVVIDVMGPRCKAG